MKSCLRDDGNGIAMNNTADENDERDPTDEPPRVLKAEALFGDKREVWIELDGVRYRLRITRRGKLILQK
jgi:hemin uptake protein HemP